MASPDLYVGAANGGNVRHFDGITGALKGDFTSGGPADGGYSCPLWGPKGDLFVQEWSYGGAVRRFDGFSGAYKATVILQTSGSSPMAFGPDGNLYVTGPYWVAPNRIDRYDPLTGQFLGVFVAQGSGGLGAGIEGMRFGRDGNLYVRQSDFSKGIFNVLRYANGTGAFIDEFVRSGSGGLAGTGDILFGPDGKLYVSDSENNVIRRYEGSNGQFIDVFAASANLKSPFGLAFGPDKNLYVANSGTDSVLRFDGKTGAFIDTFASPTFRVPTYITFGRELFKAWYPQPIDLPHYEIFNPWWWFPPQPGPPRVSAPWLREFGAALALANAADQVSPELRASVLEVALRQISVASSTLKKDLKKLRPRKKR